MSATIKSTAGTVRTGREISKAGSDEILRQREIVLLRERLKQMAAYFEKNPKLCGFPNLSGKPYLKYVGRIESNRSKH